MELLKNFLKKYSQLAKERGLLKEVVIDSINKTINIKLTEKDFDIKNSVVYIKKSSAVKSEIFIHKEKILKEINEVLPVKTITNIQ